jgi:histidine ammonia-lyase
MGITLSISDIVAVARSGRVVQLDPATKAELIKRREQICEAVSARPQPAYGFNRGFGHNVDLAVAREDLAQLQKNLIRSHSSGVGPAVAEDVVRATMLLRAHSLAQGHSGVRPEVIEQLVSFLNAGITPAVPRYGSVGASGDLAPLSHIALALIGEGSCTVQGAVYEVKEVLRSRGLAPLELQMKEGLALNNGVQFSNALGILAVHELRGLLQTAVVATALTNQVLLGSDDPYGEGLMNLRLHPGAQRVATWLRSLMKDSPLRNAHSPYEVDGEVQDPYNLRCAPQILGACFDLIEEAAVTFEREANSITDNPLLLADPANSGAYTSIVSGGHFHGMPVAVKLYNLVQAMAIMARLSNMRAVRYVDQARNKGLGSDLVWPGLSAAERATSSGMMIPEYASAALTNEIWGLAMPSHLFSLSTDAGQEDHVSMSATLGARVHDMLPRLGEILAIELGFAHQAAAVRRELDSIPSKNHPIELTAEIRAQLDAATKGVTKALGQSRFVPQINLSFTYELPAQERSLSPVCERVLQVIGQHFPIVKTDRELSSGLSALSDAVRRGQIVAAVAPEHWASGTTADT